MCTWNALLQDTLPTRQKKTKTNKQKIIPVSLKTGGSLFKKRRPDILEMSQKEKPNIRELFMRKDPVNKSENIQEKKMQLDR